MASRLPKLSPRIRHLASGLAFVLAAGLSAGCTDQGGSGDDGQIDFHPLERKSSLVEPVEDPGPPVSLEDNPEYRQIIKGFRQNAGALFEREDIGQRLAQIEKVFVATGRYLELMAIYQDVVEERGLDTEASPRLAWAYVRLGQEQQARELLDKLLEARADDADVHFIDGSFWFNRARQSPVAAARTAVAWERALELDPNFKGYEGITATAMQKQVAQLKSRLPKAPAQMVREAEAQKEAESTGAGEGAVAAHGGQMPGSAGSQMPGETERNEEAAAEPEPDAGAPESDATASAESDTGVADGGAAESTADAGTDDEPEQTPVPILLTRAAMSLNQGKLDRAESIYGEVLDRDEGNIDARIGLVRLDFNRAPEDGKIVQKVRRIAESDRLTASQAYDLGLFADVKLGEKELARELWEKVRALDPEYADRLGLE